MVRRVRPLRCGIANLKLTLRRVPEDASAKMPRRISIRTWKIPPAFDSRVGHRRSVRTASLSATSISRELALMICFCSLAGSATSNSSAAAIAFVQTHRTCTSFSVGFASATYCDSDRIQFPPGFRTILMPLVIAGPTTPFTLPIAQRTAACSASSTQVWYLQNQGNPVQCGDCRRISCLAPGPRSPIISLPPAGPRSKVRAGFKASPQVKSSYSISTHTPMCIVGPRPPCRLLHNNQMEPTRRPSRAMMRRRRAAHLKR